MVREALGPDAAGVTFVDVSLAYTRPARTLADYHSVYAEELQKTPTSCCVESLHLPEQLPDLRSIPLANDPEQI